MGDGLTVLARLARVIAVTPADDPLPVRLCRACVEVLGADGGALTLASTTNQRLTLSTSNGVSAQIEDLQDVLGEGPGQDAYRDGRTVITQVDGFSDDAFPVFSEMAGDLTGPLTVWAIPMHPGGATIGVITVYRRTGQLSCSLEDAQLLADSVGAALLDDPSAHGLAPFSGWSDRARVHQATGMVVAQLGIGAEDALAILRAHAFARSTTMSLIAVEVIERRLGFTRTDSTSGTSSIDTPDDCTTKEEP
ncbi:GAF and ANTAR domain-containing protein [uncultured Cellulomonas sp.]|uniref:GAF and ANTAR domain-containing protein n=1 Tax=uncultured Cellulomonas sp. TaxID=189682 RepID=UPI0028EE6D5E|nr:GAF and ANTAR domain-containing protein [uncultured Cellulomonas sp.]